MPPLPTGKVPLEVLRRCVFSNLGIPCEELLKGPNVGEDAAILKIGERALVLATDPITGAKGKIGWLSVHVNANDVASCGVKPRWYLAVALLPEGGDEELLNSIMVDINSALIQIGASLIGGHTETTPGLDRPIIVGLMIGETEMGNYVTTGGARPGDSIILTKGAGIEGTGILAQDLRHLLDEELDSELLDKASNMLEKISVVPEAMKAMEVGGIHSLHDPTEGGVLNGLWEMAEASDVGFMIEEEAIPIAKETRNICQVLAVDPLKLLGSGSLLIVVEPERELHVLQALSEIGIEASIIGSITPPREGRYLIKVDGTKEQVMAIDQDELYRILDELG